MRLLFIGKRQPQQRDLVERPYGRFHHLPIALAALGHEVEVLLCSHRGLPATHARIAGVDWFCEDIRGSWPAKFYRQLVERAREFRPDWVIGMSDTYYGWLARQLARKTDALFAVDAYDNYEAYMPWNLPLHALWRNSICAANLVTAAGPQLAQRLQSHRHGGHPVEIIPMAADPEFKPLDKLTCRESLGLPVNARVIGYVGSWAGNRGTGMLIDAFRLARSKLPDLQLLLSGRPPQAVLTEPGVRGTGYVADTALPVLLNALDLACVITADNSFGRYSYPAKLCEAMACGVPVVATSTEPVRWMLGEHAERHLVPPGDALGFANRLLELLAAPQSDYGPRREWGEHARQLSYLLATGLREKW